VLDQILKSLVDRLAEKGMKPDEIPLFIGSLANTLSYSSPSTLDDLNSRIHRSGWPDMVLDEETARLAMSYFQLDGTGVLGKAHK
jgi:hypothetical protein